MWSWTLDYVREPPFGGGFEAYRGNRITYETRETEKSGDTASVETTEIVDASRGFSCGCCCKGWA